jgi:hypothetical protein
MGNEKELLAGATGYLVKGGRPFYLDICNRNIQMCPFQAGLIPLHAMACFFG